MFVAFFQTLNSTFKVAHASFNLFWHGVLNGQRKKWAKAIAALLQVWIIQSMLELKSLAVAMATYLKDYLDLITD